MLNRVVDRVQNNRGDIIGALNVIAYCIQNESPSEDEIKNAYQYLLDFLKKTPVDNNKLLSLSRMHMTQFFAMSLFGITWSEFVTDKAFFRKLGNDTSDLMIELKKDFTLEDLLTYQKAADIRDLTDPNYIAPNADERAVEIGLYDLKNLLNKLLMERVNISEFKGLYVYFYFLNIHLAFNLMKHEHIKDYIEAFEKNWDVFLKMLKQGKAIFTKKVMEPMETANAVTNNYAELGTLLVNHAICLTSAYLELEHNVYLSPLSSREGYDLSIGIKPAVEANDGEEILRPINMKTEVIGCMAPLYMIMLEIGSSTNMLGPEKYESDYQRQIKIDTPVITVDDMDINELNSIINRITKHFDTLLDNIRYSIPFKKSNIIQKPKTEVYFYRATIRCMTLLPYFIIAHNKNLKIDDQYQARMTKFNDILFKFALLTNSHYTDQFVKSNEKSIEKSLFIAYANLHKGTIKKVVKQMKIVFDEFTANLLSPQKMDEELKVLDAMVENIYRELHIPSINHARWLEDFADGKVTIFSTAKDLYVTFEDPEKVKILETTLKLQSLNNNEAMYFKHDNIFIFPNFRTSPLFLTKKLENDCKKALKNASEKPKNEHTPFMKGGAVMYIEEEEKKESRPRSTGEKTNVAKTNQIKQQKEANQRLKEEAKKAQKAAQNKVRAPREVRQPEKDTTENNNNNQSTITIDEPRPVIIHPQKIEVVFTGKQDEKKPQFARPMRKNIPQLGASLNHHLDQLDSAYNEIENDPKSADNLSMRYFVLYHGIRMLEAALLIANTMDIKYSSELYKQMLSLRDVLTDRLDFFLDPETTDKDLFSCEMEFTSIFCQLECISHRLQCFYTTERPKPITLTTNPIYNQLCPKAAQGKYDVVDPPVIKMHALLTSIQSKCTQRLGLFIGKMEHAYQLDQNPFFAATVKLLLCEIGALARRIRNDHSELAKTIIKTNLSFDSYRDEYKQPVDPNAKSKKPKKRILPSLKNLGPDDVAKKLDALDIGDILTLMIEIRNRIGHDDKLKEEQDFPEEITTELAFDIAKHLLSKRRVAELNNLISQITPEDKKKLNINASSFNPTSSTLNVGAPVFTPRPMSANSSTFTPQSQSNVSSTLFNNNNANNQATTNTAAKANTSPPNQPEENKKTF